MNFIFLFISYLFLFLQKHNYKTDKPEDNLAKYERHFSKYKDQKVKFFELGILDGGSLLMWRDYFTKGLIVGLDINKIDVKDNSKRIKTYTGDQKDIELLKNISEENAPEGFDIILDDASHFGHETFVSFIYLFKNYLKSGGIYVIEDWATGFWPHYPDGRGIALDKHHVSHHLHTDTDFKFEQKGFMNKGKYLNKRRFQSHDYGMNGVVKQIIDEVGIDDATNAEHAGSKLGYGSLIDRVEISRGVVVIYKV